MITTCRYCDKVYDTKGNEYIFKIHNGEELPEYKDYVICPICKNINCIYISKEK